MENNRISNDSKLTAESFKRGVAALDAVADYARNWAEARSVKIDVKVKDKFKGDEFDALLDAAWGNVSNDWENKFVEDIMEKYKTYGDGMYLSEKQKEKLEKIASGEGR